MKATVIVDNIKNNEIPGEWGLCIFIEYGHKKILLDAGASTLFSKNPEIGFERVEHNVIAEEESKVLVTIIKAPLINNIKNWR